MTCSSNTSEASRIMADAGNEYTKEFLKRAEHDLEQMSHPFLVPSFELRPHVYMSFDSNYVTLTMRYIVDPHQRRAAKTFLSAQMLKKIKQRNDIQFGSTTMEMTLHDDRGGPEMGQKAA